MGNDDMDLRVDPHALSVVPLAESDDDEYWWSRTPEERLEAIEIYRQIVYGYGSTPPRFRKDFLEVVSKNET